jgi:hypothetical protein
VAEHITSVSNRIRLHSRLEDAELVPMNKRAVPASFSSDSQARQDQGASPGLPAVGRRPQPSRDDSGWTRRQWLKTVLAGGFLAGCYPLRAATAPAVRRYHVCLSAAVVEEQPHLLEVIREAGVSAVWLAGFFYGHEPFSLEQLQAARRKVERAGLEAHLVNVPLGHPGDSLGARDGAFPLTPPTRWRPGQRPDGRVYVGTSLHPPATDENVAALKRLRSAGFRRALLDDDFRLARGPGEIGGCFCDDHRRLFLSQAGYAPARWDELLEDVRNRRLTPLLRRWIEFTCDELTASFRAQQQAFGGELGNMVMYLGAEKAGIRLEDYRHVPLRIGELMFNDSAFGPVKGKTDELFSALFHRRFVAPGRAYSETTAFPADRLSARNMAAKLVISTLADVRNTMFMSGLTPFPVEHWTVLKEAMHQQAAFHETLAGHAPRGPFKHLWGEAERCVGEDRPFSLWLALGIPVEVVDAPARDGWTFLSDFDARALAGTEAQTNARLVCRSSAAVRPAQSVVLAEALPDLFAFKQQVMPQLGSVPHVVENEPAVCAWYPMAGQALLWNLSEDPKTLTLRCGTERRVLEFGPLQARVEKVG